MSNIRKQGRFSQDLQDRLVDLVAQTGNLKASCAQVGISNRAVYYHIDKHPEYRERIEEARQKACYRIESEMYRRGVEGVDKDVYFGGEVIGVEKQYSDKLLITLAKANMPHKYSEKQHVTVDQHITIHDHAKLKLARMLNIAAPDDLEGDYREVPRLLDNDE